MTDNTDALPPLMSDTFHPNAMTRRSMLGGVGIGAAGAAASMMSSNASAAVPDDFDTMDPETNLRTLLKIQGF